MMRAVATARIAKYAARSLPALVTSVVVFAVLDWLGVRVGIAAAAAFAAGAVPNWRFNREWVWPLESRGAWARESVVYTPVAVLVWGVSTWASGHTQNWAKEHVSPGDLHRVLLTTGAYVVVQAAFFTFKFFIFDNWAFRSTRTGSV
jgi:putative flippase GtrA